MSKANDYLETQTEYLLTSDLLSSEILRGLDYEEAEKKWHMKKTAINEKGRRMLEKSNVFHDCKSYEGRKTQDIRNLDNKNNDEGSIRRGSVCIDFSSELLSECGAFVGNYENNAVSFINAPEKENSKLSDSTFFFSDESTEERCFGGGKQAVQSLDDSVYDGPKLSSLAINKTNFLNSRPFKHWAFDSKRKLKNYSMPSFLLTGKEHKKLNSLWDDYNAGVCCSLPIVKSKEPDSIMRITVDTVNEMLSSKTSTFVIIDCRFEYEYQGGHLEEAININTPKQMEAFYRESSTQILIFHCEYSSIRAPRMARYLRNLDRKENDYPALKFPEIYIMEGGYKLFYEKYDSMCTPMHYVSMDDANESFPEKMQF